MEVVRVDMQVAVAADIVVTGRNVEVPAHYRVHIAEKLARLERYGSHVSRIVRYDVVLDHEKNPRQSKVCQRVEITGRGTGPTVRAEACGPDFRSVLDAAVGKLQETLRRSHDRRRVHHGRHQPTSVAAATAPLATAPLTAAVVTDPDPCRFASTKPLSAVLRRGPHAWATQKEADFFAKFQALQRQLTDRRGRAGRAESDECPGDGDTPR
jgi:ribosomal subunit interface protein